MSTEKAVLLIPAYNPPPQMTDFLSRVLSSEAFRAVLVINDGSDTGYSRLFEQCHEAGAQVLHNPVNLGKGAALRHGIRHMLTHYPGCNAVTADADGQHAPEDIVAVAKALEQQPDALVLGVRTFSGPVPLRSRFGNSVTRYMLRLLTGMSLQDTQTGLRGLPATFLSSLVQIKRNGYEFELEMLLLWQQLASRFVEIPIQTIYEEKNKSSHFNPFYDSARIYFVLLRFSLSSLLTAILDNLLFILVFRLSGNILFSQAVGRVAGATFQYFTNKNFVFRNKAEHKKMVIKFVSLVILSGTASYLSIQALVHFVEMKVVFSKILVELLLYLINFFIQRNFIFHNQQKTCRKE